MEKKYTNILIGLVVFILILPIAVYADKYLSSLLTPVIGISVLYIAWRQYKTDRMILENELRERKLSIYRTIMTTLDIAARRKRLDEGDLYSFLSGTSERHLLFGDKVVNYVEQFYDRLHELQSLDDAGAEAANERENLVLWLRAQNTVIRDMFAEELKK